MTARRPIRGISYPDQVVVAVVPTSKVVESDDLALGPRLIPTVLAVMVLAIAGTS